MKVSIRSLLRSHTVPSGDAFASVVAPAKWRTVVCVGAFAGVLLSQGAAAAEPAAGSAGSSDDTGLAEITVTAEKYTSTIQNTPISMSAMSGAQLTAAGISNIEDVARDIPGLSMRSAGPGLTEFEARGLASNGGAAPTVGFYLDEIPLSPPAMSQSGKDRDRSTTRRPELNISRTTRHSTFPNR